MVLGALGLNALLILLIPVGFIALVVSLIKRIANNHHYIYFEKKAETVIHTVSAFISFLLNVLLF